MQIIRKCIVVLCCFFSVGSHAQEAVALAHYVFPSFIKGKVQQKSGSVDKAMLNYNVLGKEIVFEAAPGQYMALANPTKIDTVFIQGQKFVPVNNEFYELLTTTAYPLFIEYTCTVKGPGSGIGYGMSSVTTASPAVKSLIHSSGAYCLKLPDGFKVVMSNMFWIFKDSKHQKANSAKQLIGATPDKKERINEPVKKNNANVAKRQDVIDLVQQL